MLSMSWAIPGAIQGALEIMKEDQSTMSPMNAWWFLQIIENNFISTRLVDELQGKQKGPASYQK